MNKKFFFAIFILVILPMMSRGFAADNYINFPEKKNYPGLYDVPEHVWGGENHGKLRDFYNKYMNLVGNANGYLYGIALPGEGTGKVVLMIGMGKEGEVCDYMLSTSEAMGYGMIMAVILGDKQTFDGLLKTVKYYQAYNPATDMFNPGLTSWCIPGVKGGLPQKHKINLPLSDTGKDVKGPGQTLQGTPMDSDQCRSSATDGDQDIAYALLMAHWQWEAHTPADSKKKKTFYLEQALARYREISKNIIAEKVDVDGNKNMFLRTGDFFGDLNHSKENVTRACDWALSHYRTAFEIQGDLRYKNLTDSIYTYLTNAKHPLSKNALIPDFGWWDESKGVLRVATDNVIENPEHIDRPKGDVANGYYWDDDSIQKWKPAGVISDAYHWNACRYPWRIALDAIHYKDHRSINEATRVARNLYNSFGRIQKKDGTEIAHDYHQLPMGTTLDAIGYLKEWSKSNPAELDPAKIRYTQEDAIWTSTAYTAPYLLAYALNDPVEKETEYLLAVKSCLDGFIGVAPAWCEEEWETDPYTNSHDPYYSGYYEDSINLLSMLSLAGDWWKPHGWKNNFINPEFSDGINRWKVIAENGIEIETNIITKNNSKLLYVKINRVPKRYNTFDLKLVQSGVRLQRKPDYSFSMNVGRSGFDRSNAVGIKLVPVFGALTTSGEVELLTMDQLPNTYYSAKIQGSAVDQPPGGLVGETTISIGFADNLQQGAELWIDNLGLY